MDLLYKDPNQDEVARFLSKIKKAKNLGNVNEIINGIFPDWIIGELNVFCPSYNFLQENWTKCCLELNQQPKKIILVKYLPPININQDYKIILTYSEILTKAGFCVRSCADYIPCKNCNMVAVPTLQNYTYFKRTKENIPETWKNTCNHCSD